MYCIAIMEQRELKSKKTGNPFYVGMGLFKIDDENTTCFEFITQDKLKVKDKVRFPSNLLKIQASAIGLDVLGEQNTPGKL